MPCLDGVWRLGGPKARKWRSEHGTARREHGAHRGVPTLSTVVPSLGTPAGALQSRVVALLVRSIGSFPSPGVLVHTMHKYKKPITDDFGVNDGLSPTE